jgi:hypothetical protein
VPRFAGGVRLERSRGELACQAYLAAVLGSFAALAIVLAARESRRGVTRPAAPLRQLLPRLHRYAVLTQWR